MRSGHWPKPWLRFLSTLGVGLLCPGIVATGCTERGGAGAPPAHSTASPPGASSPAPGESADAATPAPEDVGPSWRRAVLMMRYDEALELVDALPEPERTTPEMRYLRARLAAKTGDHATAVKLLDGLEEQLPVLEPEIRSYWAESAAVAGPFDAAAQHFEAQLSAEDLVKAADALLRGGDAAAAYKKAGEAIERAQIKKRTDAEAAARHLRMRIKLDDGKVNEAVIDMHWLAEQVPASPEGVDARAAIKEHQKPLSTSRLRTSIDNLISGGLADEAVELAEGLTGVSKPEKLHIVAWSLYRARRYPEAVEAFQKASETTSGRTAEQLYYQARALARMGKTDEAVDKHAAIVRRFRKGIWADRAAFQRASLLLTSGRFAESAAAYEEYAARFPKGTKDDPARYDLALAYLSSGKADDARRIFTELAADARKREVGRLRQLEGVAAHRAGDRETAERLWRQVIAEQPLTWGAMMSRSRLASLGVEPPPVMAKAGTGAAIALDVELPPKVALLSKLGLDDEAEEALSAMEQVAARPYEGREGEALCEMYGKLSIAGRRFKVGAKAVAFDALMRTPSDDERWAWRCLYPRPYAHLVEDLEAKYSIPSGLVHGLMRQESAFKQSVTSYVGAAGLMQLMPKTAAAASEESGQPYELARIKSPDVNLGLGSFYIGKLLGTFEGNIPLAVASYNAGPTAVSQWLAQGGDLEADLFVARIPYEETRTYVGRVMGNLARYQWLHGGNEAVIEIPLELPVEARAADDAY